MTSILVLILSLNLYVYMWRLDPENTKSQLIKQIKLIWTLGILRTSGMTNARKHRNILYLYEHDQVFFYMEVWSDMRLHVQPPIQAPKIQKIANTLSFVLWQPLPPGTEEIRSVHSSDPRRNMQCLEFCLSNNS